MAAFQPSAPDKSTREPWRNVQRLIERKEVDLQDAQRQAGCTFAGPPQLEQWLREWEQALLAALA